MSPLTGIALVLGALGVLLLGVRTLQAPGRVGAETARKLVHLGMGCVCLAFPWLFAEAWPVWALAGLAGAGLGALRAVPWLRRELGGVLHDVNRTSLGEIYFPLGVAAVFTLARGDTVRFVVPVALLAFADAAGALVGKRWGRRKFATLESEKSVEGSLAVGVTGLVCAAGPLLATGHEWRATLLVGAVIGLFALMLEAISWRGLDNIFLPLAAYAQISVYLGATPASLVVRLGVLAGLAAAALAWRRGQVADDCARLGAALALYFFWAVGGWMWLVAPAVLLASYARLMPTVPGGVPRHNLIAVICVSSAGVAWAVAQAFAPDARWAGLFTVGLATQQAVIALVRFSQARVGWSRAAWWAAGVAQAVGTQGLAFVAVDRGRTFSGAGLAAGALCVAAAAAGFVACERNLQRPENTDARWWKQGAAAVLASVAGLILIQR
jgi:phytol kinase